MDRLPHGRQIRARVTRVPQSARPAAAIDAEGATARYRALYFAIPLMLVVAGCGGGGDSPTSPSPTTATLDVRAALDRSIQDEYRSETTYQGVVNDLGPLLPFVNVLTAEQRHSLTIAQLFTRHGLTVPPSAWSLGTVPHYSTTTDACRAAAAAERANVAMYDELLRLDLPTDVRQAFTNVRAASLENHVPAFDRCS
jgi:hypothetical protein